MAVSKPTSFAPELKLLFENLKNAPYPDLLTAPAEAGWETHVQEIDAVGQADGTTLVRFSVAVGREGKFEPYDTVTVKTGVGPGPVSIAARLLLPQSLVYLFFGRLPPQQNAAPEQTVDVAKEPEGDIVLPEAETEEADAGGEYVQNTAPISRRAAAAAAKLPDLIDHTEPDGVPVFVDFDSLPEQFTTEEIIGQFIVDINAAAVKFSSPEQLLALYTKNSAATDFLKELGSADDKAKFKDMLDAHQARLTEPAREVRIPGGAGKGDAAPRRRRAA